eukprot:CAMPEP_0172483646 /NCGR_PEP_ID=MMETSP1066-20121228/10696_1 /TAXON_ID=671091 /ORGANISM="Coscinodiscus wailesii, Strain CCMP2513" /LENGTH=125 /DNA_ID=CAMNT_0013247621 /DNA_START=85 /DNA_END=462 /DNA_ORIENTATION=-
MTSRLLAILRILPRTNASAATQTNSWAKLCLWRRYFEMKEEEEEERLENIAEVLEPVVGVDAVRPIMSEKTVEVRKKFVREHYRNISQVNPSQNHVMHEQEQQQIRRPNLDIPVNDGQSYVTLAQ